MIKFNKQLDILSKEIWEHSTKGFEELERIKLTLINIRISVAKLDNAEARALDTIADYITHSIDSLEKGTYRLKEISKEIRDINNV